MRILLVGGLVAGAALSLVGNSLRAQPNPFKMPKMTLKGEVNYELKGDQSGTAQTAFDSDRYMSQSTGTIKMMGKTTKSSTWSLITPDAMYMADLEKKKGTEAPNMLPYMAKAYDDLDGPSKKRFHENFKDMTTMVSRVFDINSFGSIGEKLGDETVAGEVCENRQFGSFTICSMKKGPRIALKSSGDLVCFRFEQTATSVSLAAPKPEVFEKPAGIMFEKDPSMQNPDSLARGFVGYFASEALADSLAKAKAELEAAKKKAEAEGKPTEMTPEQKEQMRAACEMIKNLDMNKVMANAMNAMGKAIANQAVEGAKNAGVNKLKGLIKKPKFP